jgi:RNA polymerase-binding protein DksA
MPDKKLDKKTLENYKKLLFTIKEKVRDDIRQMSTNGKTSTTDAGDVSGHALHMADVATDMYDREFNLGLASNDRELLHKIDAALVRIQDGDFGLCLECHKTIPAARLKAIPYTETCLKCQEKIEAKR